jgi:hypothetical protein
MLSQLTGRGDLAAVECRSRLATTPEVPLELGEHIVVRLAWCCAPGLCFCHQETGELLPIGCRRRGGNIPAVCLGPAAVPREDDQQNVSKKECATTVSLPGEHPLRWRVSLRYG